MLTQLYADLSRITFQKLQNEEKKTKYLQEMLTQFYPDLSALHFRPRVNRTQRSSGSNMTLRLLSQARSRYHLHPRHEIFKTGLSGAKLFLLI